MNDNEIPFIIYLNNLNRFTKSNCLSEGSFSTVNTVKDISSGNLYCVKSFELIFLEIILYFPEFSLKD